MDRLTRHEVNLGIAKLISKRGTCQRLQVGCVITHEGRLISSGYNGPLDSDHDCGYGCDPTVSCTRAVHSEANAIYHAAKMGISLKGSSIYCTHSPCEDCVEAIVQSGIQNVYFIEEFRTTEHLLRLRYAGVKIVQFDINPDGTIRNEKVWY